MTPLELEVSAGSVRLASGGELRISASKRQGREGMIELATPGMSLTLSDAEARGVIAKTVRCIEALERHESATAKAGSVVRVGEVAK